MRVRPSTSQTIGTILSQGFGQAYRQLQRQLVENRGGAATTGQHQARGDQPVANPVVVDFRGRDQPGNRGSAFQRLDLAAASDFPGVAREIGFQF